MFAKCLLSEKKERSLPLALHLSLCCVHEPIAKICENRNHGFVSPLAESLKCPESLITMVTQIAMVLAVFRGTGRLLQGSSHSPRKLPGSSLPCWTLAHLGRIFLRAWYINPAFSQNFIKATEDCSRQLSSGWLVNSWVSHSQNWLEFSSKYIIGRRPEKGILFYLVGGRIQQIVTELWRQSLPFFCYCKLLL